FVPLMGYDNVAGHLHVRRTARQQEIAVRVALGAGTRRIVRQLLSESVLLSLLGGLLGLLLTPLLLNVIVTLSANALPRVVSTGIDRGALVFTFVVIVGTGILFGLAPALEASRAVRYGILKAGGGSNVEGRTSHRPRRIFGAAEAAM